MSAVSSNVYQRVLFLGTSQVIQIFRSVTGVIGFWLLATLLVDKGVLRETSFISWANTICFGVYLFQQFILQVIYYKTAAPIVFGPYWLPWFGFMVTWVLSSLFSWMLVKTKVGRFILG